MPFHISNFKFLAENQPDILGSDRNGNQGATDYMAGFWADKLDLFEGQESIPETIIQEK